MSTQEFVISVNLEPTLAFNIVPLERVELLIFHLIITSAARSRPPKFAPVTLSSPLLKSLTNYRMR